MLASDFTSGRSVPVDLDLVVPALNEERRIGPTIVALSRHLEDRPWRSRILVVDNGSVDGTVEVVDANASSVPVVVIGCRVKGKGAAVKVGIGHSTARWVGYCDADLATSLEAFDAGVEELQRGTQVVVGSRRCGGADYLVGQPLGRRVGSYVFHLLASRVAGGISDTQCGFKLFDGPVGRQLFRSSQIAGFAFDVEILAQAHRRRMSIIEVPVRWSDQEGSTFRPFVDGVRAVSDLRSLGRTTRPYALDDLVDVG